MKKKLLHQSFVKDEKQKIKKILFKEPKYGSLTYSSPNNWSLRERNQIVLEGQSGQTIIREICLRENITPFLFYKWTQEFLENKKSNIDRLDENKYFSDDEKFKIVLEGNNGEYSVEEICNREKISYEEFFSWSNKFLNIKGKREEREKANDLHTIKVKELIGNFIGEEGLNYFESFIDVTSFNTKVFSCSEISSLKDSLIDIDNLVCLTKSNDIRYINKYFEKINENLPLGGIFIGCFETFTARKERLEINKVPVINDVYFGIEFILKRILPKLDLTKKYYFNFTKGKDRLLSKAEGLGRLVCCGFKIIDFKSINGLIYFVVKKVDKPKYDTNPSYGPVYQMPRIGKDGKIIKVYKLRTMHPYSEYLQDYIIKVNGYSKFGKPANDFRIPKWGKTMRKIWLDELPQLINVLKGEMKLVGVRPVSKRYFQDIPKEMQKLRLTQKPGCIPPYVALNREGNVMSVLQAEKDYLEEKIKNPYTTDIKYFLKAIINIIFKHKRSA